MHIGGVLIFEGPPPAFEDFLNHIRGRLHLVPRYRQRLATPPLETGRPLWVDDPTFNLEYHVRHTALPEPGTERQLFLLASRIASQQLDRSKPLWENWLVEGLEGDRFALISKTHHSLVDGVSGVDLATVLFDLEPNPATPAEDLAPWRPQPEPSQAQLVAAGVRGMVNQTVLAREPRRVRGDTPGHHAQRDQGRRRGDRRDRVGRAQPGARDPAQRRDRTAPALHGGPRAARRLQGGQERARRHRQRRGPVGRVRSARKLAALARRPHRGPRDARAGAGVGPDPGPARHAGQPADRDAGSASRLHHRSGGPAEVRQPTRWTASRSQSRRSARPRSWPSTTSRRRRSSRRRRG